MRERIAGWWARLDKRAFAVVAVALAVRLVWIAAVRSVPISDYLFYWARAIEVAAGKGYVMYGHPTAYWPPGWPFFLSIVPFLFGPNLFVAKLLNVALWTLSAWLMYVLGKRIGGPTAGLVSGLVVALYPEYVFFSGLTASENLFVPMVCIVAVLLSQRTKTVRGNYGIAAIVGLLLGYSILVRPAAILLPLTLCFVVWFVRRSDRGFTTALVIGLCGLLALAPWVVRNKIAMGEWLIATNGGGAVWGGAHQNSTGTFMRPGEQPKWMAIPTSVEAEVTSNREGSKLASQYMRQHPWEWVSLAPTKLVGLFDEPGGLDWNLRYHVRGKARNPDRKLGRVEGLVVRVAGSYRRVPGLMKWIQALEWIVGGIGLAVALFFRRRAAVWPFAILAYWIIFDITLSTGQPRYLVSTGPLLAPGVGYLVAVVANRFRRPSVLPAADEGETPAEETVAV